MIGWLPSPVSGEPLSAIPQCDEHHRPQEYFCTSCDELLCANCLLNPVHRSHDVREAKDVVREEHELLRCTSLENADKAHLNISVAVTEVADMVNSLRSRGEEVKGRIQEHFQAIHEALRRREQVLISTTDTIISKKVRRLQEQSQVLMKAKVDLDQHISTMKGILARRDDYSFLRDKKTLMTNVAGCVNEAQGMVREPVETTRDGPDLYLAEGLLKEAGEHGEVFCQPYPPRFIAKGNGLKKAFLDREADFVIQAYDRFGLRSYVSGTEVAVSIQGPNEKEATPFQVTEQSRGEYVIRYTPRTIGVHCITMTAGGTPIHNSTANVFVFNSKDYLSLRLPQVRISKHQIHPEVSTLRGVCTLPNNNIVFADAFCLRVVTPDGQLVRTIGSFGNGPGQFSSPFGVGANKQGHIFVTDSTNHRVEKFSSSDGHFMSLTGTNGTRNGCFNCPEGIALLGDEKLYVADRGNNRIQVFAQKNWRHVTTFGKRGNAAGQLDSPRDVAVDTKWNRVLVTDTGNLRVQAFSLDGKPLQQFGSGNASVLLNSPYFVSTDTDGFILVTETRSRSVAILTPQGKFVRHLGSGGEGAGQFRAPYGVCVNSLGQLIISDSSNHCLQVF